MREDRRPPFPLGFEHVYEDYANLSGTRDVGMAVGPITYLEIQAYQAMTHAHMSAWEVSVVRRIDTAIRALQVGSSGAASEAQGIPITDTASLKALLRSMSGGKPRKVGS